MFDFSPVVSGSGQFVSNGITAGPTYTNTVTYTPPKPVSQSQIDAFLAKNNLQGKVTVNPVMLI